MSIERIAAAVDHLSGRPVPGADRLIHAIAGDGARQDQNGRAGVSGTRRRDGIGKRYP